MDGIFLTVILDDIITAYKEEEFNCQISVIDLVVNLRAIYVMDYNHDCKEQSEQIDADITLI